MSSRRPRNGLRSGLAALGVIALAVAAGVLVWFTWTRGAQTPTAAAPYQIHDRNPWAEPSPRPVAVFIGDSYTQGEDRWPSYVAKEQGWKQVNLGRGGTGYRARDTAAGAQEGCEEDVCR